MLGRWRLLANGDCRGNMLIMIRRHPRLTRVIALLCLLMLQVQAYAAGSLACRHSGEAQAESVAIGHKTGCPHGPHLTDGGAAGAAQAETAVGDCQKCSLGLCLFGGLGLIVPHATSIAHAPPTFGPVPSRHFYSFSPDRWVKPPISLSA